MAFFAFYRIDNLSRGVFYTVYSVMVFFWHGRIDSLTANVCKISRGPEAFLSYGILIFFDLVPGVSTANVFFL